ncbi:MAG: DUF2723 domain-containing protein [Candidatus Hydrogenedentota bacterium]
MPLRSPDHKDCLLAAGAALASFIVYLMTLAPTVSGEDGGELVAAAYSLGIPHPTGYPLWTMLAHAFIKLIPFGEVAWRVNLMSAFWASGTVALVVLTLRSLQVGRLAAGLAGLVLAYSREFWEQSVIAEVYTLNAFFVVMCIYLLLDWTRTRSTITIYLFTLIYSLSLSNHSTMYLLGPVFLVYLFAIDRRLIRQGKTLGIAAILFVCGLLVHLYLPIRSMANPAMDWGNPETLQNFWNVFTRVQYSSMMTGERSLGLFMRQMLEFLKFYVWEFTPWVLWLIVPGLIGLYQKSRATLWLSLSVFVVVLLASILVPNFPIEYHFIWMNTTFWIPLTVLGAMWLGFGLDWLINRLSARPWIRFVVCFIALIIPLFTHGAHSMHNDQSDYYIARDYAKNVLDTMEPNAIYFGGGDHTIFPLVYMQIVEGYRTDVTIANKYGYIQPELYADMPGQRVDSIFQFSRKAEHPAIFNWLLETTDRPVYTINRWPGAPMSPTSYGLLYRYPTVAIAKGTEVTNNIWDTYTWSFSSISISDMRGDWTAEVIGYEHFVARARSGLEKGEIDYFHYMLRSAANLIHGDKRALHNIALLCASTGEVVEAANWWEKSLSDDPHFIPALYNLARALHKLDRDDEALVHAETLLELESDNERFIALRDEILN